MTLGLLAAFAGAVCFGVAAVLQAVAARQEPPVPRVDPLLVVRLARHPVFVAAVAVNLAGFVLHVVALRELPLFLAQTITSSSVVVTALLASRVLHVPLTRGAVAGVGAVAVGITALAVVAAGTGSVQPDLSTRVGLLASVAGLAAAGALAGRLRGAVGALLLALVAGLAFTVSAVASRVLTGLDPVSLATDPAAYAIVSAGPLGFLLYSTALQRAGVLTVTAPVLLVQTGGPAVAGVLLLGDELTPGGLPLGVAGLAVAVAGAVTLARFDPQVLVAGVRVGGAAAERLPPTPAAGGGSLPVTPAPRSGTERGCGTVGASTTRRRCFR